MMATVVQALLTLYVLISLKFPRIGFEQVSALPITSKPIESTAENLAWQAWIMMPPHEQNLEKSRKVTPKSIFLLPNRVKVPVPVNGQAWTVEAESGSGLYAPIECPPGQRQFESRCISTLDIDREQLLIQELQILLQHGGNNNNQNIYDYDYDYDEESVAAGEANYKPPMMFKGDERPPGSVSGNYDDAVQLPNEDMPLKFNIFSENYPTDVEMQHQNINSSDPWSLAQLTTALNAPNATSSLELKQNGTKTTQLKEGFPITGIDAIILPAVAKQKEQQNLSFFKDDSSMQLVTTIADRQYVATDAATTKQQQTPAFPAQLKDLLKFDSLLPLQSPVIAAQSTPASTKTTLATTATLKATTLQTPARTTTTTTRRTLTSPSTTKTTSVTLAAATTTLPKQSEALLAADERVASQDREKEERIRSTASVTNEPETTMNLLPTTLLNTATTANSEQLQHTTAIVGVPLRVKESQKLKKTKVEPVEEKPKYTDGDDLFVNQATPLPTAHKASTQKKVADHNQDNLEDDHDDDAYDDRFYYQPVDAMLETTVDGVEASGQHEVGASTLSQLLPENSSTLAATTTTTTATSATATTITAADTTFSEIDVAAELRAINELVKKSNKRQGAIKKKITAAAKSTKNDVAIATTKATSRSTTNQPTSAQPLLVETENSVDYDIDAVTSASRATAATTNVADSTLIDTTKAAAATTAATTLATIDDEATATATLWAKIMPLLGFGITTTTTTTEIPATASATAAATTTSSSNISSNSSLSSSTNRSHRNSKITRIDKLSTNSLSDNAKKTTTGLTTTTTKSTNGGARSKAYVIPLKQEETATERPLIATTTATATTSSEGSFSPFWWLPAGWRLDRPTSEAFTPSIARSNNNNSNKRANVATSAEPSLLLRFWSAFPGNQVKIRD